MVKLCHLDCHFFYPPPFPKEPLNINKIDAIINNNKYEALNFFFDVPQKNSSNNTTIFQPETHNKIKTSESSQFNVLSFIVLIF
jgi:hypothetical protein